MSSLPFVEAPHQRQPRRIGTSDTGVLEVPVLGGLTVLEGETIAELLDGQQSAFVRAAQLADVIAQAESTSHAEAFSLIEQAISGVPLEPDAEELRLKYAERIEEVARVYNADGKRSMMASVTAIIRHRLDRPNWTLEDTGKQPRALIAGIWELVLDEQAAESMPTSRPDDEAVKKPRPATGAGRGRTGRRSSGS